MLVRSDENGQGWRVKRAVTFGSKMIGLRIDVGRAGRGRGRRLLSSGRSAEGVDGVCLSMSRVRLEW